MAGELLLDTGALISLLDRSQSRHADFVEAYEAWKGAVVSSEAVLTEATHLLGRSPGGAAACVQFFVDGGAVLVPSSPASLRRSAELVKQYADLPMDYADATLVVLGEELNTKDVLTTDGHDFAIYRLAGRRRFRVRPD